MNILIIYGGKSCEHDISLITACLAKGYFDGNIISAYMDRNNRCFLAENGWTPRDHVSKKLTKTLCFLTGQSKVAVLRGNRVVRTFAVDVAVNCCHGVNGEDGSVAALCRLCNIPLVGSDILSSAVAMDKCASKTVLGALQLPTVWGVTLHRGKRVDTSQFEGKYPIIVKPATLGSSIGVSVCRDEPSLLAALQVAFGYDPKVLAEQALTDFTELNCSVMRVRGEVQTSRVDSPPTVHELLTFADKYLSRRKEAQPADVSDEVRSAVADYSRRIYTEMEFSGVIRVDYLLDNTTGKLYVNEINATPGSLAYGLWEMQYSRTQFGEALVDQAIADYRELQQRVYVFESGVLGGGNLGKK